MALKLTRRTLVRAGAAAATLPLIGAGQGPIWLNAGSSFGLTRE